MLNRKIIYFTLLLTVLGLIGIYSQLSSVNQGYQPSVNEADKSVSVLTVNRDIQAGESLKSNQLNWVQIPKGQAESLVGVIEQSQFDLSQVSDAILAYSLAKDDFLRRDALLFPTDSNYLSAVLAPGKRGLAIKVDAQSAMAGLVKPGDKVDVLFYHKFGRSKKDFGNQISASVRSLVSNVKLLAIDKVVSRSAVKQVETENVSKPNSFNEHSTVTLELDVEQASKLLIAQQIGQLSLALVSKRDQGSEFGQHTVAFDQVLPELRQNTDVVSLFKGNNQAVFITNDSLMMSTKAENTGGDDNVF